jgi:hypothetical protein
MSLFQQRSPALLPFLVILLASSMNPARAQMNQSRLADPSVAPRKSTQTGPTLWLKTGPAFQTISNPSPISTSTQFHGGLGIDFDINAHASFETGISYLSREFALINASIPSLFSASYLVIPAMIKYKSGTPGSMRFYSGLGGYAGFAVSSSARDSRGDILQTGVARGTDFGVRWNVGTEIPVSESYQLLVGADLDWGLNSAIASQSNFANLNTNNTSVLLSIALGIQI